jgi:glycopeptide antibiotics resistance protein
MRTTSLIPIGLFSLVIAGVLAFTYCKGKSRATRQNAWYVFAVRFFGLFYALTAIVVVFKLEIIGNAKTEALSPFGGNIVPFRTIIQYIGERNSVQLIGNIVALLPLPILLHLNFPQMSFKKCCIIALCTTALVEPVQLLINTAFNARANIIDIDDFLLNTAGCLLGLALVKLLMLVRKNRNTAK